MSQISSYFYVEQLEDAHDEKAVKKILDRLPGIKMVSVNLEKNKVGVDFDNTGIAEAGIMNYLYDSGYPCVLLRRDIVIQ